MSGSEDRPGDEPTPAAEMPELGETLRDKAVALVKGAVGAVPLAGGVLGEIVSMVIPQQRMQRLEVYVALLNARLASFEEQDLRARMADPQRVDLFEEGAFQSARALSDERREYIANVVAHGLTDDQVAAIEAKRILALLAAIDDDQIVILASHLHRNLRNEEFIGSHLSVLEPVRAHLQSSPEEHERATMWELSRAELIKLGLLRHKFRTLKKGELPQFDDKTGMMKAGSRELSPLGRLLLRRIGVAGPDEH